MESGTVDELEGSGIQVEVAADLSTTFTAIQIDPTDPGNPSICSKPLTYWNSSTANEEPPAKGTAGRRTTHHQPADLHAARNR